MSDWILIAVFAYLLFAINGVIDKILLTKAVRSPLVYAFFNGTLAPFVLVLVPFGIHWIGLGYLLLALLSGACFTIALYFYYTSIQKISISRALPIQGGFVPLFTLILAAVIIKESLSAIHLLAFIFLTGGAALISFKKSKVNWGIPGLGYSMIAAVLFALHFVLAKFIYDHSNFVTGLFWTRWGMFLVAILILIPKKNRIEVFEARSQTTTNQKVMFYSSRAAGGIAGLLQNLAISIGSVTIVNALSPTQKLLAIALVIVGLILLSY
ncbi:MAG: DMT family transporter [Candidatus Doudnabacteria bacterium]|nr:DMT family transporter [Candidatus Doudnabacteria bacterium]